MAIPNSFFSNKEISLEGIRSRDKKYGEYHWQCPSRNTIFPTKELRHTLVSGIGSTYFSPVIVKHDERLYFSHSYRVVFVQRTRRTSTTITNEREISAGQRGGPIDVHAIGTRVIPWQRIKNLTQLRRGGAARRGVVRRGGMAGLSARYITGHVRPVLRFFCLSYSSSPPFPSLFHANSLSVWSWITPTTPP